MSGTMEVYKGDGLTILARECDCGSPLCKNHDVSFLFEGGDVHLKIDPEERTLLLPSNQGSLQVGKTPFGIEIELHTESMELAYLRRVRDQVNEMIARIEDGADDPDDDAGDDEAIPDALRELFKGFDDEDGISPGMS